MALLDAATQLLLSEGPDAVTMGDIASAAGVAPRTLFNHFETRGDLVAEVARERAVVVAMTVDASAATSCVELMAEIGEQFEAMAGSAGPHYRAFLALLTRYNSTGDVVRDGALGGSFHAFASRLASGREARAISAAVAADLLLGALIVAVANFAADPQATPAAALVDAGTAVDRLLGRTDGH